MKCFGDISVVALSKGNNRGSPRRKKCRTLICATNESDASNTVFYQAGTQCSHGHLQVQLDKYRCCLQTLSICAQQPPKVVRSFYMYLQQGKSPLMFCDSCLMYLSQCCVKCDLLYNVCNSYKHW